MRKDVPFYIAGVLVGVAIGVVVAFPLIKYGTLPWILGGLCAIAGFIVAFVGRSIVHAFAPSKNSERGQLTIGDLIGYGLLAGLFVLGVANIQFINDFTSGVEGMIMLGLSANAADSYQGLYKQLPCAGTSCSVTPANFTYTGDSSSTVLGYTPTVWGDTANDLKFTDTSTNGGSTSYTIAIPRSFDTRVIHVLALTTYQAGDTHMEIVSGQGITAEQ